MLGIEIIKRLGGSGGGGGVASLVDNAVIGFQYAQWTISPNGLTYTRNNSGASVLSYPWVSPGSESALYEVRATLSDGDNPPGTEDTWLDFSQSRIWGWVAPQANDRTCNLLIEIRRISDSVVVTSATITLECFGTN